MALCSLEAALSGAPQAFRPAKLAADRSIGQPIQSEHLAAAAESDQGDLLAFARLEANRSAGGNVQMHPKCLLAIELQRPVGFEEMVVATDLDRAVARVDRHHCLAGAAGIDFDLSFGGNDLARLGAIHLRFLFP